MPISAANVAIAQHCRQLAVDHLRKLEGKPVGTKSVGTGAHARRAVDRLIRMYREHPDYRYDAETMEQVLKDAANHLDDRCDPPLARPIDRELR